MSPILSVINIFISSKIVKNNFKAPFADCRSAECRHAECLGALSCFPLILSFSLLRVLFKEGGL